MAESEAATALMKPLPFDPELQCTARSKQTLARCRQPIVANQRVCRFHGGASKGRNQYSALARRVEQRAKEIEACGANLTVAGALVQLQAVFECLRATVDERGEMDTRQAQTLADTLSKIVKGLKILEEIRVSKAITPTEITTIQTRMAAAIGKYLPDPQQRAAFIAEVRGDPPPAQNSAPDTDVTEGVIVE